MRKLRWSRLSTCQLELQEWYLATNLSKYRDSTRVLYHWPVTAFLVVRKRWIAHINPICASLIERQFVYTCPVSFGLPVPVIVALRTKMVRKSLNWRAGRNLRKKLVWICFHVQRRGSEAVSLGLKPRRWRVCSTHFPFPSPRSLLWSLRTSYTGLLPLLRHGHARGLGLGVLSAFLLFSQTPTGMASHTVQVFAPISFLSEPVQGCDLPCAGPSTSPLPCSSLYSSHWTHCTLTCDIIYLMFLFLVSVPSWQFIFLSSIRAGAFVCFASNVFSSAEHSVRVFTTVGERMQRLPADAPRVSARIRARTQAGPQSRVLSTLLC